MVFRSLSKITAAKYAKLPVVENGRKRAHKWYRSLSKSGRTMLVKNKPEGVHFKLTDASVTHTIVMNGSKLSFQDLAEGHGMPVSLETDMHFLLEAEQNYGLKAFVLVLEYDDQRRRLGHKQFVSGRLGVYRPSAGTAFVMICVRMQGEGWLRVKALHMNVVTPSTDTSKLPVLAGEADANGAASLLHKMLCDMAASVVHKPNGVGALGGAGSPAVQPQPRATLHAPLDLRVGIITDIYMFNFYKGCFAELYYLSPDNFDAVMAAHKLDAVMYVTCWAGLENDEWRGIMDRARPKEAIDAILAKARAANVPTLFQSIEDPSNFEHFLPLARKFDHIFTSDADMVEAYKAAVGHSRVCYGEYGVNPLFNNPVGSQPAPLKAAFFAGSYPSRYAERCADMQTVFDSLIKSDCDLVIADRNYGSSIENVAFPERYEGHLVDKFDHTELQAVHKLFRYNINFNSIQDSPTMCAMRVYELQAQGTNMLSNYARSLCCRFPGVRMLAHTSGQLDRLFAASDDWYDYKVRMHMVRAVMTERTGADTARRMARRAGLISEATARQNAAHYQPTVFVVSTDPACAQPVLEAQSYKAWVLTSPEAAERDIAAHTGGPACLTFLHAGWDYEAHYLQDMVNALKYTDARYITKDGWYDGTAYQPGREHAYVSAFPSKCCTLFYLDALEAGSLDTLIALDAEAGLYAPGGYSIDPFELNVERTLSKANTLKPALATASASVLATEDTPAGGLGGALDGVPAKGYTLSLIVPVHSDTAALEQRLIPSLRLNEAWPEMELLLAPVGEVSAGLEGTAARLKAYFKNVCLAGHIGVPQTAEAAIRAAALEAKGRYVGVILSHNDTAPAAYDMLLACAQHGEREMGSVDIASGYEVRIKDAKTTEVYQPQSAGYTVWQRAEAGANSGVSQSQASAEQAFGPLAAQATLVERAHMLAVLEAGGADASAVYAVSEGADTAADSTYSHSHAWEDYRAANALIARCVATAKTVARTSQAWVVDYADYRPDKDYHGEGK